MNLLPHRLARRQRQAKALIAWLSLCALLGLVVVLAFGAWHAYRVALQEERNGVLQAALAQLALRINAISTLRQEIKVLTVRLHAFDEVQAGRNATVSLLSELAKQAPAGLYLTALRQDGARVTLSGHAQSQQRVAELLRNLSTRSAWLERPDLVEVRAAASAALNTPEVEFTVVVALRRDASLRP